MVLHARLVWWVGTVSQAKVGYMARRCFQNLDWAFFRSHRLYSTWVSFNYGCVAAAANTTPLATAGDMMAAIDGGPSWASASHHAKPRAAVVESFYVDGYYILCSAGSQHHSTSNTTAASRVAKMGSKQAKYCGTVKHCLTSEVPQSKKPPHRL